MKEGKRKENQHKSDKYDPRAIQALFRTVSRNHYQLLKMIDNKASIVLTVNSIIISLLMGALYISAEAQRPVVRVPAAILINCSMFSMVFALISMLPHKYFGKIYRNSDYEGSLYAANFARRSLEEFEAEIQRITASGQSIYKEITRDLYFLGRSIHGKQIVLFISVGIFLLGLIGAIGHSISHGLNIFSQ